MVVIVASGVASLLPSYIGYYNVALAFVGRTWRFAPLQQKVLPAHSKPFGRPLSLLAARLAVDWTRCIWIGWIRSMFCAEFVLVYVVWSLWFIGGFAFVLYKLYVRSCVAIAMTWWVGYVSRHVLAMCVLVRYTRPCAGSSWILFINVSRSLHLDVYVVSVFVSRSLPKEHALVCLDQEVAALSTVEVRSTKASFGHVCPVCFFMSFVVWSAIVMCCCGHMS